MASSDNDFSLPRVVCFGGVGSCDEESMGSPRESEGHPAMQMSFVDGTETVDINCERAVSTRLCSPI